ncbi:hypothetical protein I4U23_025877 [Adineta vaga]|nr:hypothetical protein I4U23_025877 [Adineta vaga]
MKRMSTKSIDCELIANDLNEPISIQLNEEQNALFVLTNHQLTRIDLNKKEDNIELVYQHKRKLEEEDEEYSQGESDEENRVEDPFEDSEPSTDDDEDKITNRRNWRRYGYRIYQLDNPCSILYLHESNQFIVLNEGVISFLAIELENNRPFVQRASKNIFCYDYDIFKSNDTTRQSIQPWSITTTSIKDYFIFSLLDKSELYSLDMRNENIQIEKFTSTNINYCPYLLFYHQSNQIFIYDSTQIVVASIDDKTSSKIDFPFIEQGKGISTMTIDKSGLIYILSDSIIYKCNYQELKLNLIECLGKLNVTMNSSQMIVKNQGYEFYISNFQTSSVYRFQA